MSQTWQAVQRLVSQRSYSVSQHGMRRMAERGILLSDVLSGVRTGDAIEDYPYYYSGPAVLVLQHDPTGLALHVVWGIEKGTSEPAVLITAYKPDRSDWNDDFRSRRP